MPPGSQRARCGNGCTTREWNGVLDLHRRVPALMVTDTAVFRYRFYRTLGDTPEKVDYDRLARVVTGLGAVVAHWRE